eukprot:scpid107810/ scgid1174/ 
MKLADCLPFSYPTSSNLNLESQQDRSSYILQCDLCCDQSDAVLKCSCCKVLLCELHAQAHRTAWKTSSHVLWGLEKDGRKDDAIPPCPTHPKELLSLSLS